jgi:hypothetical protein
VVLVRIDVSEEPSLWFSARMYLTTDGEESFLQLISIGAIIFRRQPSSGNIFNINLK